MRSPFGNNMNGAMALLAKGWTSNLILFWQTGQAFTATNSWTNANGSAQINLPSVTSDRPSMVVGQSYKAAKPSLTNWLNLNAFTPQPAGTPGNEAPYQFFGPHTRRADLSIVKNFELPDKMTLQFRAEAYNISNTPNFGTPNATISGGPRVRNTAIFIRLKRGDNPSFCGATTSGCQTQLQSRNLMLKKSMRMRSNMRISRRHDEQSESEGHMTSRRELIRQGIGLMAATAVPRSFVAQSVVGQAKFVASPVDPMQLVNPQFRAILQSIVGPDSPPTEWTTAMLAPMREGSKMLDRPLLPAPAVVKRMIPGPKGAPEVPLYITGATAGASKPAVLHLHGGGYIAGSAAYSRRDIQELAANHDCVAISVDYRLAPETPFPGSLEDIYMALLWMYAHAAELGIDRSRIAIKGESAGGGHAAALAIAARDRGEVPLCLQVLIYSMLDDRTGSTMPVPPYIGHYIWTAASNRFGWTSLLGKPASGTHPQETPGLSRKIRFDWLAYVPPYLPLLA
jgi:acetyl esterase/lipase